MYSSLILQIEHVVHLPWAFRPLNDPLPSGMGVWLPKQGKPCALASRPSGPVRRLISYFSGVGTLVFLAFFSLDFGAGAIDDAFGAAVASAAEDCAMEQR